MLAILVRVMVAEMRKDIGMECMHHSACRMARAVACMAHMTRCKLGCAPSCSKHFLDVDAIRHQDIQDCEHRAVPCAVDEHGRQQVPRARVCDAQQAAQRDELREVTERQVRKTKRGRAHLHRSRSGSAPLPLAG